MSRLEFIKVVEQGEITVRGASPAVIWTTGPCYDDQNGFENMVPLIRKTRENRTRKESFGNSWRRECHRIVKTRLKKSSV